MTDVFVSYKAEDRRRVQPLVQALQCDGFHVWWDEHIGAGDAWRETIEAQLESARCVLVVWSKNSVGHDGRFVRDEASRALRRGVYVPVLLDAVEPPLGFGETQAPSMRGWRGDRSDRRYLALIAAIRRHTGPSGGNRRTDKSDGQKVDRRALLAGGGLAALTAAGGGWLLLRPGTTSASGSIAILPFANLSGDPAQAYFADGIAEELRAALSRIPGLKVVARTSSEAVRNVDAKTASKKLGVENILTGSVRRSATMVRVSAQLVSGRDGVERWSEMYDRAPGDALQIQTEIAQNVAQALRLRLGGADRQRLGEGGTNSAEAHDLLLKAKADSMQSEGSADVERAIGIVDSALAIDPKYADAYAAKATMLKILGGALSPDAQEAEEHYREASLAAQRAIQLAPQSRAGYGVLAEILYERLQPRAALAQYQHMRTLPGDATSLLGYAVFLGENRRVSEGLKLTNDAIAADPLNPLAYSLKAYVLAMGRRYREAIEITRQQMELLPGRRQLQFRLGYYYMMLGDTAKAAELMETLPSENGVQKTYKAVLATRLGRPAEAEKLLGELRQSTYAHFQVAEVLAQLGRKGEAIDALNSAWEHRDSGLTTIQVDQLLDPLRGDPRFEAIVRRIDFPK